MEKSERERLMNLLKDKTEVHDVGHKYVSRWKARRAPYFLSVKALKRLDKTAILGKKNNHSGIFYPIEDIRIIANETSWIPPTYISEVRITKQVKAGTYDRDNLRQYAVWGKKKGEYGPSHYYYSEETIMTELAIAVIPTHWVEGKDYVLMTRYPEKLNDLPLTFAIQQSGPLRQAAFYYWGEEATSSVTMRNDGVTRAKRNQTKESVPNEDALDNAEDEETDKRDLQTEIQELKKEIHDLQRILAKKEYRLKMWGKDPIYSDDTDTD